jgi:toxin secretion/phage lysis holin
MNEAFYWLKWFIAAGGAFVAQFFGGWSAALTALVVMAILDYASGVYAAFLEQKLSSSVGFRGIARKVFIFVIVAAAHMADLAFGNDTFLRDMTVLFYLANEGISLLENAARAGLPVPGPLRSALDQLKKRSEEPKEETHNG